MSEERQKDSVTVRIGGEDHVIRTRAEAEYTRACARWVDERIGEVKRQLGLIEGHRAAILAALSITDELFQARNEADALRRELSRRAGELARRLEGAAPGPRDGQLPPDAQGTPPSSRLAPPDG